jgi:hypothetical protein
MLVNLSTAVIGQQIHDRPEWCSTIIESERERLDRRPSQCDPWRSRIHALAFAHCAGESPMMV